MELGHLARTCLLASEGAIEGIDQTAVRFEQTMFVKFKSFAPDVGSEKDMVVSNSLSYPSRLASTIILWSTIDSSITKAERLRSHIINALPAVPT